MMALGAVTGSRHWLTDKGFEMDKYTHILIYSYKAAKYTVIPLEWRGHGRDWAWSVEALINSLLLNAFNNNKPVYFATDEEAKDYDE
jgi:hypothetical protein